MTVITTNRPVDETVLRIVKDGFEEQKNVKVLSIYEKDNNIYGIYINPLSSLLSFVEEPLYSMSTDIDGHNIFMTELGTLLHLIYHNGSVQMYQWLLHPSGLQIENDNFQQLIEYCTEYPPYNLASFHLIKWIEELNNGNLNMSLTDLVDMVKIFMEDEPLDIDIDSATSDAGVQNKLNEVRQLLKEKQYQKVSETALHKIDKCFVDIQLEGKFI